VIVFTVFPNRKSHAKRIGAHSSERWSGVLHPFPISPSSDVLVFWTGEIQGGCIHQNPTLEFGNGELGFEGVPVEDGLVSDWVVGVGVGPECPVGKESADVGGLKSCCDFDDDAAMCGVGDHVAASSGERLPEFDVLGVGVDGGCGVGEEADVVPED